VGILMNILVIVGLGFVAYRILRALWHSQITWIVASIISTFLGLWGLIVIGHAVYLVLKNIISNI